MSQTPPSPPPTAKETLVRRGIVDGGRAFTGPFGLQVGVTDYCNFACEFCHTFSHRLPDESRGKAKNRIAPDRFYRLVEEAAALGVEQISLVGVGEPSLHPEIVRFVAAVKGAGIRCMLTTNGLALTDEKLVGLVDAGLDLLNVSVNAATPATYAAVNGPAKEGVFPQLVERLAACAARPRDERPGLKLRLVVSRRTGPEIVTFARLAADVGADEVVYQHYIPHPAAADIALDEADRSAAAHRLDEADTLLNEAGIVSNAPLLARIYRNEPGDEATPDYYRTHPCLVGWTYAMILEDGVVRPCCYCGPALGNIGEASLGEIWFGPAYDAFRRAAVALPETGAAIDGCRCFTGCGSVADNIRTVARLGLGGEGR
jgi:MoaA/NifB/PqqE/SkfB family radical SAM enzyme